MKIHMLLYPAGQQLLDHMPRGVHINLMKATLSLTSQSQSQLYLGKPQKTIRVIYQRRFQARKLKQPEQLAIEVVAADAIDYCYRHGVHLEHQLARRDVWKINTIKLFGHLGKQVFPR